MNRAAEIAFRNPQRESLESLFLCVFRCPKNYRSQSEVLFFAIRRRGPPRCGWRKWCASSLEMSRAADTRRFTQAFIDEALERAGRDGVPKAALELGISKKMLARWATHRLEREAVTYAIKHGVSKAAKDLGIAEDRLTGLLRRYGRRLRIAEERKQRRRDRKIAT